jgi:hypothetical protein
MTAKALSAVIAGLEPAILIMAHGGASLIGMAGSSPAMTIFDERNAVPLRRNP